LLAASLYLQHREGTRIVIIGGDGPDTQDFQELVRLSRELGILDRVTLAGRVEQEALPAYYSAANVFVLPSHYETFGLVALESLACGTPVVATRVGAMEKVIRQGQTGYVVDNGHPRTLASGIEAVLSLPQAPSPDVVRVSVLEYDWANVASAMAHEYVSLQKEFRPPTSYQASSSLPDWRSVPWPGFHGGQGTPNMDHMRRMMP
jgi:D-inositol-3-phosphate glycosyltransferase